MKVIVGGDGGVGKTTYLYRLCKNTFITDTKMTVGVSFMTKTVEHENFEFSLAIWDFGGQDQFRFILKSYVKGAHAGLIFFALDRAKSFFSLEDWIGILRSEKPDLPVFLVGTKADLEDPEMAINDQEISDFLKRHDILGYIKTSSKTGQNINVPIEEIVKHWYNAQLI
ncbi:MAG: Rab family GTPase [Promethearchaeota archaeon]